MSFSIPATFGYYRVGEVVPELAVRVAVARRRQKEFWNVRDREKLLRMFPELYGDKWEELLKRISTSKINTNEIEERRCY